MKKLFIVLAAVALLPPAILSASPAIIDETEMLLEQERIEEAIELVENRIPFETSIRGQAELYTLLSKCTLQKAARLDMEGGPKNAVLSLYSEGEQLADKAVKLDPSNHLAYFWRGSNAGMWGKLKGVFAALDRVQDMRADFVRTVELAPDFSFAWFSLGQMYRMVPGGIISFGNKDYAVSLGRKAVDTMEREFETGSISRTRYDYYVQLAVSLHARNWSKKKREDEMDGKFLAFHGSTDVMGRGCNYEGTVDIPALSDREEAEQLLLDVLGELRLLPRKTDMLKGYIQLVEETYNELF
jgi:tetratricopeptide (TPR) repeat protein